MIRILFLLIFLSSCQKDPEDQILVGMSMDFPPFDFVQNGEPAGFDVDLMKEIAPMINKKVKFVDIDFGGIIAGLNGGKIDVAISGIAMTEERKKNIDFIGCYYHPKIAVLYNKKKPINSELDFHGNKIGVQNGTTMEQYLKKLSKKNTNIHSYSLSRNSILVQELKLGRIDGVLLEDGQAVEFSKHNEDTLGYSIVGINEDECYSIALPRDSKIKAEIVDAITKLQTSGRLREIEQKWFD